MAEGILRPGASFYVYLHRRATDGKVFYVGKGTGRRARKTQSRNPHWQNIVAKHGYTIEYVATDVQEWYALERESELIAYFGRDSLCNLTDGGDGVTGLRHAEEARAAIGLALRGRKLSAEHVANISAARRGRVVISEEQRRAISTKLKGRKIPSDVARRGGLTRTGLKRAEATKEKMRASWGDPGRRAERAAAMSAASGHARKVRCIETGVVFEQIKHADNWLRSLGLLTSAQSVIGRCCNGKGKTAGGYRWEFVPDENITA